MFENEFDEAITQIRNAHRVPAPDHLKVRLFARFLGREADPFLFQRFTAFMAGQAIGDAEIAAEEAAEETAAILAEEAAAEIRDEIAAEEAAYDAAEPDDETREDYRRALDRND